MNKIVNNYNSTIVSSSKMQQETQTSFGIYRPSININTGEFIHSYYTQLNDINLRKLDDGIYRFYFPDRNVLGLKLELKTITCKQDGQVLINDKKVSHDLPGLSIVRIDVFGRVMEKTVFDIFNNIGIKFNDGVLHTSEDVLYVLRLYLNETLTKNGDYLVFTINGKFRTPSDYSSWVSMIGYIQNFFGSEYVGQLQDGDYWIFIARIGHPKITETKWDDSFDRTENPHYVLQYELPMYGGELGFTSIHSIYNLSQNQQYQPVLVTPKFIDFKIDKEELNYSTDKIYDTFTPNIDNLQFNFGYNLINQNLNFSGDIRNDHLIQRCFSENQQNTKNLIAIISNQQRDWTKWYHWDSQRYWDLTKHEQYISDTDEIIYSGLLKEDMGSKISIRDFYHLKEDNHYTFSIKLKSVSETKTIPIVFRQYNITDDKLIYSQIKEYPLSNYTFGGWNTIVFSFLNEIECKNKEIEISIELRNFKNNKILAMEPQLENNGHQTPFVDGYFNRLPHYKSYYNLFYFKSFVHQTDLMISSYYQFKMLIDMDINQFVPRKNKNHMILHYIKYDPPIKEKKFNIGIITDYSKNVSQEDILYIEDSMKILYNHIKQYFTNENIIYYIRSGIDKEYFGYFNLFTSVDKFYENIHTPDNFIEEKEEFMEFNLYLYDDILYTMEKMKNDMEKIVYVFTTQNDIQINETTFIDCLNYQKSNSITINIVTLNNTYNSELEELSIQTNGEYYSIKDFMFSDVINNYFKYYLNFYEKEIDSSKLYSKNDSLITHNDTNEYLQQQIYFENLSNMKLVKSIPIPESTFLYVKANNIFFYLDTFDYTRSVKLLFQNIFNNKFEMSFISIYDLSNNISKIYPYNKSILYPDLNNLLDGKLLEYTNLNLPHINKNDIYDGKVI